MTTGQKNGRTLLYYPTIKVPSGSWLKQALLYWDEVASIVPRDWDEKTLIPYSPDIKYLHSEGIFRPIRPESLIMERGSWEEFHQFEQEFSTLVASRKFTRVLGPKRAWVLDAEIHANKISKPLIHHLKVLGLASIKESHKRDSEWFMFERKTALLYMSSLAKYLADIDEKPTTPSTDREDYNNLIYLAPAKKTGFVCTEVLFKHVLPVPREDVSLKDIVEFRNKRRSHLLHFREAFDEFEGKLSSAESSVEIRNLCTHFKETVERKSLELKELMDDSKVACVLSSLRSLIDVKSPTFWSTVGVIAGKATKVADIPIEWSLPGLVGLGAIEVGCQLVDNRNKKRAALRDSAFSYLYYSKELS